MPSQVGASHNPRRPYRTSLWRSARVRVSDQTQMAQDPPQPRRIQPSGRLHQHRLGRHRHLLGQLLGAMSQHPSMGHRELPTRSAPQPWPPADHGTGPWPSGHSWPRPQHPAAAGSATRPPSSQPAGPGQPRQPPGRPRRPAAGARGPPAGPPTAAGPGPVRPGTDREAVQILGRQPVHGGLQRRQPSAAALLSRMCVRVHGHTLPNQHHNSNHQPPDWGQLSSPRLGGRAEAGGPEHGAVGRRASASDPQSARGPGHPDPPCQLPGRVRPVWVGPATASCGGRRRSSAGSRGRLGCS